MVSACLTRLENLVLLSDSSAGERMFAVKSVLSAHPPAAAAEACASTRVGDSATAQCSPWCGLAHCASSCKCRACSTCTSPPLPPPPRPPAPPPPPRTCVSKVAGDANVEGCASWCREKESTATKRVRHWRSARPDLWRLQAEAQQLRADAATFTRVGSLPALQVQVVRLLREQSGPLAAAFSGRHRRPPRLPHRSCAGPGVCRSRGFQHRGLHTEAPRRPCEAGVSKLLQARRLWHLL